MVDSLLRQDSQQCKRYPIERSDKYVQSLPIAGVEDLFITVKHVSLGLKRYLGQNENETSLCQTYEAYTLLESEEVKRVNKESTTQDSSGIYSKAVLEKHDVEGNGVAFEYAKLEPI